MPTESWPAFVELLTSGGDTRIACGESRVNKYGCAPTPQPDILSYSSSTASSISTRGFAAAEALYERLVHERATPALFENEMHRIRHEWRALCELPSDTYILFGPSGTDMHRIAVELFQGQRLHIIMPEPAETGSGIPEALNVGNAILTSINSRMRDGNLRPRTDLEEEITAAVTQAILAQQHVLLVMTDMSKTGLIIPSISCALALKERYPDALDILVDACQFRLANTTLNAYLAKGFLLAVTGSKFIGGPAFSAALLVPESAGLRTPAETMNWGLLLRTEAALAELRALRSLPEADIRAFLEQAARAIHKRFISDTTFLPLPIHPLDRTALTSGTWDAVTTIFPFLLRHPSGTYFTREETLQLYHSMQQDLSADIRIPPEERILAARRCFLGQPVLCGVREGIPISALRLNMDARLIVEALQGRGAEAVIAEALLVLDKVALLARHLF
jgi:hypothetical protein